MIKKNNPLLIKLSLSWQYLSRCSGNRYRIDILHFRWRSLPDTSGDRTVGVVNRGDGNRKSTPDLRGSWQRLFQTNLDLKKKQYENYFKLYIHTLIYQFILLHFTFILKRILKSICCWCESTSTERLTLKCYNHTMSSITCVSIIILFVRRGSMFIVRPQKYVWMLLVFLSVEWNTQLNKKFN